MNMIKNILPFLFFFTLGISSYAQFPGGGGGRPGLATAGGKNVEGLADALAKLIESAVK